MIKNPSGAPIDQNRPAAIFNEIYKDGDNYYIKKDLKEDDVLVDPEQLVNG